MPPPGGGPKPGAPTPGGGPAGARPGTPPYCGADPRPWLPMLWPPIGPPGPPIGPGIGCGALPWLPIGPPIGPDGGAPTPGSRPPPPWCGTPPGGVGDERPPDSAIIVFMVPTLPVPSSGDSSAPQPRQNL